MKIQKVSWSLLLDGSLLFVNDILKAGFGFFYWVIAARLVSSESVGLIAGTLSIVSVAALIGSLGLGLGILKYYGVNERVRPEILGYTLKISFWFVLISFFAIMTPYSIIKISKDIYFLIILYCLVFFTALNGIIDNALIATGKVISVTIRTVLVQLGRILIVLISINLLGEVTGIMMSLVLPLLIINAVYLMMLRPSFGQANFLQIKTQFLKFSFVNGLSQIIQQIPYLVLPGIILAILGPKLNAIFYFPWMIVSILYAIGNAFSLSLFAMGSRMLNKISTLSNKSLKYVSVFLFLSISLIWIFGEKVLLIFGKWYSNESFYYLKILSISSIFVMVYQMIIAKKRFENDYFNIILYSLIMCSLLLGFSLLSMLKFSLLGVVSGWTLGSLILAFCLIIIENLNTKKRGACNEINR